jgi:FlaA1/EpsC-like NDP-sugar epimerase
VDSELAATGYRALRSLRARRRATALFIYGTVAAGALLAAFFLRFEFSVPAHYVGPLLIALPSTVVVKLVMAWAFGLTMGQWRFVGTGDVIRLFIAGSVASGVLFGLWEVIPVEPQVPWSVIAMDWAFFIMGVAAAWITYRKIFEHVRLVRSGQNGDRKRVVIVGAGEAGNLLAREILRFPIGYRLVAFVDDDPSKWGSTLHGIAVMGATEELPSVVALVGADEVIIATPSARPEQLRQIVARCEEMDVPFKVLPGIREVLDGNVRVEHVRELRIDDLLGREPIRLELPELAEDLNGACVLITGGAGSIGSELARQIALHKPSRLVLFDQAESDLYFLELELRDRHPHLDLVSVVGDILDPEAVDTVFGDHRPCRVFHAAAYKHVPMMETNVREAVRNNVLGTWEVAKAAAQHGAEKFVLISTDKAAAPSSVMGATKRVAELVTMACQERYRDTSYVAVRFGNVLGSNGSVIPLFQRQLREGGPLTVTHPEVTRYFMTTSEAVQLLLQASMLPEAQGGIAMLDMGEPVKIVDLAKNVARLSGARVGKDVEIEFIGLRAGEKLHEDLSAEDERTRATRIEKVRIVECDHGRLWELGVLGRLHGLSTATPDDLRIFLSAMVGVRGKGPRSIAARG